MSILLATLALVAQLNLTPVYPPDKGNEITQDELSYIAKPILVETIITKVPIISTYKPLQSSVTILYADNTNNCVAFSKAQTGINKTMGAGGRLAINSQTPEVGKIGSLVGPAHAVVIEKVDGDMITFRESNFKRGFITRRTLPKSDFLGFII